MWLRAPLCLSCNYDDVAKLGSDGSHPRGCTQAPELQVHWRPVLTKIIAKCLPRRLPPLPATLVGNRTRLVSCRASITHAESELKTGRPDHVAQKRRTGLTAVF